MLEGNGGKLTDTYYYPIVQEGSFHQLLTPSQSIDSDQWKSVGGQERSPAMLLGAVYAIIQYSYFSQVHLLFFLIQNQTMIKTLIQHH